MKWNKAIKEIETALADGKNVTVIYHRKWARNAYYRDNEGMVERVVEYEWQGNTCKAVTLRMGQIDEGNFIIDEVISWDEETVRKEIEEAEK